MQEEHRKAIQMNFGSLVEQTDLDLIVSVLYEKGVFNEAMIAPYRDVNKDMRMRKRELYRDIERRGPTAFGSLLEALTETGHWDLVRALDPDSNLHPRRPHHPLIGHPVHKPNQNFVSLSKNKEVNKNEHETQQSTSKPPKTPYPRDFSKPGEGSVQIPQFSVIKSTEFHRQSKEGFPLYPTRSRRRGMLVAFSFIEFSHNIEEYRKGAEVDCTNLKYLFDEIGFKTIFYNNLTKDETEETLRALREMEAMSRGKTECVFVVVSSHGYERGHTSDTEMRCHDGGLVSKLHIIDHFNNSNFPTLRGVPKVFIFQSCRGTKEDHVWTAPRPLAPSVRTDYSVAPAGGYGGGDADAGAGAGATDGASAHIVLTEDRLFSDILIAQSTLPGFVSHRDSEKGSWYIQALCEVFAERAHDCHVDQLFTLVDRRLYSEFKTQTSSVERWGFNSRLYLHPGLFED